MKGMAALLAAIALVGAGCGDDDDNGAITGTTTVEETTDGTEAEGTINGSVGPGFEISITPTGPFEPGSYELTVEDLSSAHNFHLSGPNVDVSTAVGDEGTETFTVDLQPGTYEFLCDPHATQMRGSFEVG